MALEVNKKILISIIVPIYNVADYLKQCVNSIINQTYDNLEIILVDDGSTDNSKKICDAFMIKDKRIKVIHKENGGLSDARNAGLEIAVGDYIGFVDSDDYIEPDMFERMIWECEYRGVPLACVRYDEVGINGSNIIPIVDDTVTVLSAEHYLFNILTGNEEKFSNYSCWVRLYRKDILSGVRFDVGKCFEDILFSTIVILNAKKCIYINKIFYHYRIREGSITHSDTKELIPRKWITDQLAEEQKAVCHLFFREKEELGNVAKSLYYQQALYYYAVNTHHDLEHLIADCLQQWKLRILDIFKLPFGLRKKVIIIIKMKIPGLVCVMYKVKYGAYRKDNRTYE